MIFSIHWSKEGIQTADLWNLGDRSANCATANFTTMFKMTVSGWSRSADRHVQPHRCPAVWFSQTFSFPSRRNLFKFRDLQHPRGIPSWNQSWEAWVFKRAPQYRRQGSSPNQWLVWFGLSWCGLPPLPLQQVEQSRQQCQVFTKSLHSLHLLRPLQR